MTDNTVFFTAGVTAALAFAAVVAFAVVVGVF
jgi:hypothetical protein